jgi:hypothetical protein
MRAMTARVGVTRSRPVEEAMITSRAAKKETKFTVGNISTRKNTNIRIRRTNKAEETSTAKNRITSKTNKSTMMTSRWEPVQDYHEEHTKTIAYKD